MIGRSMINSFTRISNLEKTLSECATFARVKITDHLLTVVSRLILLVRSTLD